MWSGLRSTFQEFIQLLSQTEPFAWMGHVGTKKMCHHFGSFWNKRLANHTIQTCSLPSGVLDMTRCLWHGSSRERGLEGPGSHKLAQTREWQSNWINWHSNQPEYDRIFMRLQRILILGACLGSWVPEGCSHLHPVKHSRPGFWTSPGKSAFARRHLMLSGRRQSHWGYANCFDEMWFQQLPVRACSQEAVM